MLLGCMTVQIGPFLPESVPEEAPPPPAKFYCLAVTAPTPTRRRRRLLEGGGHALRRKRARPGLSAPQPPAPRLPAPIRSALRSRPACAREPRSAITASQTSRATQRNATGGGGRRKGRPHDWAAERALATSTTSPDDCRIRGVAAGLGRASDATERSSGSVWAWETTQPM